MPEHVRQGLVENAGGRMMCPHPKCRLPVAIVQVVTALKPYTVYATEVRVSVASAQGGLLASDVAVVMYLECEEKHPSHVAFETNNGETHTETQWDDDPQPTDEELRR